MNKIRLHLTPVSNLTKNEKDQMILKESKNIIVREFDPRMNLLVYDREGMEKTSILVDEFDPRNHLVISGEEYYFCFHFETIL